MVKETKKPKKKKRKIKPIVRVDKAKHMIITPVCRLSFPNLFVAKAHKDEEDGKKTFHCDLIVDSEDVWKEPYRGTKTNTVSLKKAILNAKLDQFGEKADWPHFEHDPIRDGDDRTIGDTEEVLEGYEGMSFIRPRTGEKYPPKLLLKNGKPASEEDLYGGCYVRAQILVRPYDTGTNAGVSLRLIAIMKHAEGEKFGIGGDMFDVEEVEDEEEESWEDGEEDDDI